MGEMDSGNSGSIQSSSTGNGDDQELESRGGESMAAFFNQASMAAGSYDNTTPFQLYSFNGGSSSTVPHHQTPTAYNNNNSFMINHNNNNNNGDGSSNNNNSFMINHNNNNNNDTINCTTMGPATRFRPPLSLPSGRAQPVSAESSPGSSDHPGPGGGGRNPKKRCRASRRAPTTVLTTDTNNFRQMVQEFTGVPAPPFSGRTRLDLFGGLGIQFPRSNHVSSSGEQQPPPYLLRPFPQKIVPNHLPINNVPIVAQQSSTKSSNSLNFINTPSHSMLTSLRPNAFGSLMNQFALGHANTTTTATTATASMSTAISSGNMIMSALNQERLPLQRQANCSVDGGSYNGSSSGGANSGKGEGMVDSWICSSD